VRAFSHLFLSRRQSRAEEGAARATRKAGTKEQNVLTLLKINALRSSVCDAMRMLEKEMKEGFQARLTTSCPMKRKWHSSPCDVGLPICSHLGSVWFWADMLHDYAREKKPLRVVDGPRTRFVPSFGRLSCISVYISVSLFGCLKKVFHL
jgi:hypothetical protein